MVEFVPTYVFVHGDGTSMCNFCDLPSIDQRPPPSAGPDARQSRLVVSRNLASHLTLIFGRVQLKF